MTKQESTGLPSVVGKLTEAEFAELKQRVTSLFQAHDDLVGLYRSLVASRQAYSLVRYYLAERLEALGESWETGAEELILQLTTQEADKSFNLADIARGLEGFLVPLLREKLLAELESDEAIERVESRRAEELRTAAPVPIELTFATEECASELHRDETLVLVGSWESLDTELSSIMSKLKVSKQSDNADWNFLHLAAAPSMTGAQHLSRRDGKQTFVKRNIEDWVGIAARRSSMRKILDHLCSYLKSNRCDVLIVEDGYRLAGPGGSVREAEKGIQALRRWCDDHKAVLVVGLPVPADSRGMAADFEQVSSKLGSYYKVVNADASE